MSYFDNENNQPTNKKPFVPVEQNVWVPEHSRLINSSSHQRIVYSSNQSESSIDTIVDVKTNDDVVQMTSQAILPIVDNNKIANKLLPDLRSKREIAIVINDLVGLQEKFFYLILIHCHANKSLQTLQLKSRDIADIIQCSYAVIKTVSFNVVHKGLVQRLNSKSSKSGFVQFALSKEVQEIGTYFMKRKKISDVEFKKFIDKIKIRKKTKNKYL